MMILLGCLFVCVCVQQQYQQPDSSSSSSSNNNNNNNNARILCAKTVISLGEFRTSPLLLLFLLLSLNSLTPLAIRNSFAITYNKQKSPSTHISVFLYNRVYTHIHTYTHTPSGQLNIYVHRASWFATSPGTLTVFSATPHHSTHTKLCVLVCTLAAHTPTNTHIPASGSSENVLLGTFHIFHMQTILFSPRIVHIFTVNVSITNGVRTFAHKQIHRFFSSFFFLSSFATLLRCLCFVFAFPSPFRFYVWPSPSGTLATFYKKSFLRIPFRCTALSPKLIKKIGENLTKQKEKTRHLSKMQHTTNRKEHTALYKSIRNSNCAIAKYRVLLFFF